MSRRLTHLAKKLALATASILVLGAAAEAAVLATPLLLVGSSFMSCFISNVSDRDTTIRIEVIGFTGATLDDSGEVTLAPGQTDGRSASENARCKFTVSSKRAVRAHATLNHAGIGSTSSAEAR